MADAITRLVIEAQAKGIGEAAKATASLNNTLGDLGKSASKSSRSLRDAFKELSGQLRAAQKDNTVLAAGFKTQSDAAQRLMSDYKNVTKQLAAMREAAARATDQTQKLGDEARRSVSGGGGVPPGPPSGGGGSGLPSPPDPRRGAFTQGLLQGALPEAFIQRGPGAFSQAAGSLIGRTARGVLGAGFELAASPLSGSQAAVSALSRIPLIGGIGGAALGMTLQAAQAEAGTQRQFQSLMPFIRTGRSPGALASLNALRGETGALGMSFGGMSANESSAMVAQMAAAGGGYASQYSRGTLREAFAAQAGLGIDAGTSGVLARGEKLGATTGAGSTLAKSIADAISLGLQGSEIVKYVQSIAGSVESFSQTGIKVDPSSRGSLGRLLEASGGYSAPRAAALSSGISASLDNLADSGPQNANQMLMLQAAGYNPADPDSYYRAQEKLDNADPGERAKIFARARGTAMKGYSGLSRYGRAAAYRAFARDTGMNVRIGEALKETSGGLTSAAVQAALTPTDTSAAMRTTEDAASFNTTSAGRMLGRMSNLDSATGQKSVGSMEQMDLTARKTLNSLSTASSKLMSLAAKIQETGADLLGLSSDDASVPQPTSVN